MSTYLPSERIASLKRRVSRQMSSGREVSGHLPSERSTGLTDTECQGKFLPDAECQGKCQRNDAHYGIYLPDEDCQGISLLGAKCQGKCHPDDAYHGICLLNEQHQEKIKNIPLHVGNPCLYPMLRYLP